MKLSSKTTAFIEKYQNTDIRQLALQANKHKDVDFDFVLEQIASRQIAKHKLPSWYNTPNLIYPSRISMEQCSSELTARYKASILSGHSLLDITGGFGVDFYCLAKQFGQASYLEQNELLCKIAEHNFANLKLNNYQILNGTAETELPKLDDYNCIYIDPTRRDTKGSKTVLLEDCKPNILELENLLNQKADQILIKLSPLFDISSSLNQLSNISELHVVSVKNEAKELLILKKKQYLGEASIHCINIIDKNRIEKFVFKLSVERSIKLSYVTSLSKYLYEPNASIMKAGAFKIISKEFDLQKLSPNSHLYTSDELYEDFPGRIFNITASSGFSKKEISNNLSHITQAHLTIRNFPSSADQLRKRLKLKDGGNIYIFATSLADDKKQLIICSKIK